MDGTAFAVRAAFDAVDGLTHHVEQATLDAFSGRHGDAHSGGLHFHAAAQSLRGFHGNGTDSVLTDVLLRLQNQTAFWAFHHEGVEDFRKGDSLGESNVDHRADDLCDGSLS